MASTTGIERYNQTHILVYNDSELENNNEGHWEQFTTFSLVLYASIFLLGMIGNILFCYVVISSRSMKSVTYRLLVNLSVSDLLITCLCGPVHVISSLVIGYWPFGSVFCYIYSSFQGIAILVSSYTLVVISFERYMSILYPLRSVIRGGGGNLYCIVFVLWTMATLASIPNIIQTRHIQINKDNTSENIWVCTSEMESEAFHYYSLAFCIFQYFLPVLLMTYFYWMVASTIWKRHSDGPQTENLRNNTRDLNMLNGRKRMIKMLMVVVACYTICWLPFNIFWVIGYAVPDVIPRHDALFPYIFTIVQMLTVCHTCINPFIYCWMNNRVRYGFLEVLGKLTIIRKCCFWVNWEHSTLTRSYTGSVYHNENRLQKRIQRQVSQKMEAGSQTAKDAAGNNILRLEKNSSIKTTQQRYPKMSTTSQNIEMKEVLRQEPLLAQTRLQRGHKSSTTSNATLMTDISISDGGISGNFGTSSSSSCRSKVKAMRTLEEDEDNNSSIDDEDHQDNNIVIGANVDGQEVVEILEEDETSPKRYTRSISDEINEQLLNEIRSGGANFFVNELSSKSDERYN